MNKKCNHDWVYKPRNISEGGVLEVRQKRICRKCHLKQRTGANENARHIYFNSYFAAPPNETQTDLVKLWSNK